MAADRHKHIWASLGMLLLAIVWGTQFLVIKQGQISLPPLMTATLRFAVLTIAAQCAVFLTRSKAPAKERFRRLTFGIMQALSFGVLYWAEGRIPSAIAGVLTATNPLLVALLAHQYIVDDRLTPTRGMAMMLGFAGVSIIVLGTQSESGSYETVAVLAILAGELASAINKVLAKQLTATVPAPVLLRDMGLTVTLLIGLASYCFERDSPVRFTTASVLAFIYLGVIASFAASYLYLIILRRYTATAMAYLQFATAAVAAVTGVVVGGEHLGYSLVPGIIAVLGGLLLLSRSTARDTTSTEVAKSRNA